MGVGLCSCRNPGVTSDANKQEDKGEEYKQHKGEVTPPKDPLDEAETSKKRKVSPMKPSSWKNSKASKPKL
jgi:hypothetical protein